VIVCLGATAAKAILGPSFRVTQQRGELLPSPFAKLRSPLAQMVMATVHPSSLLRAPDAETRRKETARFVADLERVAKLIAKRKAA
jgi:DNA polymerase